MRPAKAKVTNLDPNPEPLTFQKVGGTLVVTNNSLDDSYLIFATRSVGETKAILFKAGTVEVDLKDVVNVTSFLVVGAAKYDLIEERQKPCNSAVCPIPPEPPIVDAFIVTPDQHRGAGGGRR